MKRLLYSFALVLFAGTTGYGQTFGCHTDHYHQQMINENPQLLKDYKQLFENIRVKSDVDTNLLVIPVVFHILHQNGIENISDQQVFDAVEVLNRDYRKRNADTALVIPAFDTLIADTHIEFRLASYDPWGNCTNGIDRIYTHETFNGDNFAKLNQWDRSKYLNIWVVRSMEAGVAGYALYPTAVNGLSYWLDGIVILHGHVGRIGTGNEYNSRSLTHEVGHWLALAHLWGSTNNPMVACGDDGVSDTPFTKGFNFCPGVTSGTTIEDSKVCDTSIYENYQNYMDYSYCSFMFTPGQVAVMRHALRGNDGLRNNLITPETHAATGIDLTAPPVCIPKPAIKASRRNVCVGQTVQFTDISYNGPVTVREWTFEDATPATSNASNPSVVFNSYGRKSVTIKVGNASGEVTETFTEYIDVQPEWAAYVGPKSFDMEGTSYQELVLLNDGDNYGKFEVANVGYNSSQSMRLGLFKDLSTTLPGSEESRYYQNLGGQTDAIITPTMDLRNTTNVTFSFDYSYATNAVTTASMSEVINVYYSRNCGETWTPLGTSSQSKIEGAALASAGFAGGIDFEPTSDSDWKTYSRTFNASASDNRTRFKIEFVASDNSNNLFIDNIMVSGTLGLADDFSAEHELTISPNPVVGGNDLKIEYVASNEPVTFILRNLQGEVISTVVRNEVNQPVSFDFHISENIAAAYYFLEVKSATATAVKKIAVIK